MSYKLGIVGSRVWTGKSGQIWNPKIINPKEFVFKKMDAYVAKHGKPSMVYSGGAKGADKYGVEWAASRGIKTKVYEPKRSQHLDFRAAAMARNTDIVNASDHVIAFWDKKSRGTLDTLTKAKTTKKKVSYFNVG